MTTALYTASDAGCYVDGARGIYATDAIVDYARHHGATITHNPDCNHAETYFDSEFAGCEFAGEYEDEATDYMNDDHPVDGCSWGRNDNGDWGLWADECTPVCDLCGRDMLLDERDAADPDDDAACGISAQWVCFCNGGHYQTRGDQ